MESCWRLLEVMFLILPTDLLCAQGSITPPTVVGYTGYDVVLPCKPEEITQVTQIQWDYCDKNSSKLVCDKNSTKLVLIYRPPSDLTIPTSRLKGRFSLRNSSKDDYSAIIREATVADEGQYTCSLSTFPAGSIKGNITLVVQDQMLPSAGVLVGIVAGVAVTLLLIIMVAYIVQKRRTCLLNHIVPRDRSGPEADKTGASEEEDLVYTGIGVNKPSRSGDSTRPSNEKQAEEGDVTYSQVAVAQPKKKEAV